MHIIIIRVNVNSSLPYLLHSPYLRDDAWSVLVQTSVSMLWLEDTPQRFESELCFDVSFVHFSCLYFGLPHRIMARKRQHQVPFLLVGAVYLSQCHLEWYLTLLTIPYLHAWYLMVRRSGSFTTWYQQKHRSLSPFGFHLCRPWPFHSNCYTLHSISTRCPDTTC